MLIYMNSGVSFMSAVGFLFMAHGFLCSSISEKNKLTFHLRGPFSQDTLTRYAVKGTAFQVHNNSYKTQLVTICVLLAVQA